MSGKDIKNLKPSKKSRYKQGYINPKSCKKLFESQQNEKIIYRSSYEKRFILWLEKSEKVKYWGSECISIEYIGEDGQKHHYWPDYIVEFIDGRKFVFEVKPYSQTVQPDPRCEYAYREYKKNMLKWTAARQFCERNGMHFKVITEHIISRLPLVA
jgi:hypothetical protein